MKKFLISTLSASLLFAAAALADQGHGQHAQARQASGPIFKGVGVVQKTDPASGSVTIAHQPIPELKWPAMTMPFAVADKGLFSRLKAGQKVEFELKLENGKAIIVNVK